MKSLIKKLVETTGPSGYESQIRAVIREEVEPLADEVRVDALGNLIVRKGRRSEGGLRIMLAAHMDEIGVMVTHIDPKGFVRFHPIGGVFPHTLPGGRLIFANGARGVIYAERMDDRSKITPIENLYADVGATSREDCPVKVGDVAAMDRPMIEIGNRLVSKAMDDRIGVAVLIEALRRIQETPNELYFVFTVQEEVGVRGATTAAFGVDPDLGVACDITVCGDVPKGDKIEVDLGKGPAIKIRDNYTLIDPRVIRWMSETAEAEGIPYQREILTLGGTDAHAIQLTRAGVPAGCLSIPTRYGHTPSEMVDVDDVENSVRLLVALVSRPVNLGEQ